MVKIDILPKIIEFNEIENFPTAIEIKESDLKNWAKTGTVKKAHSEKTP